jgi:hypothetical protein
MHAKRHKQKSIRHWRTSRKSYSAVLLSPGLPQLARLDKRINFTLNE